ncbi:hypothetical protein Tco_0918194 [Tanacetum coccineum]
MTRGEGHIARQCTQLKRAHNSEWFKEKMPLAQAQEAGVTLDEEHIAFLEDKGERVDSDPTTQALTNNDIFQTDGIDAFDSDFDEAPTESETFMENLFDYGSDVLSEMQYSEQPVINDDSSIEITSDSNVISYDQYLKESENEVVQSTASHDQQNVMIKRQELFIENDRLLEQILSQDIVCTVMHSHNFNDKYASMEKSYVKAYNQCLELEAELVKKKDMIKQDVFIKLSKSYSKLEKHCISLEIVVQQSKKSFQNDKPCENQDAPEFHEFFKINELKA